MTSPPEEPGAGANQGEPRDTAANGQGKESELGQAQPSESGPDQQSERRPDQQFESVSDNPTLRDLVNQTATHDTGDEQLETAVEEHESGGLSEFRLLEQKPGLLSDPDAVRELVNTYGAVRGYFIAHGQSYHRLQRSLNQARWGTTYDRYLTKLVYLTVATSVLGVLFGFLLGWVLSQLGVFAALTLPFPTPGFLPEWLVATVGDNRAVFAIALVTFAIGTVFATVTWYVGMLYPGQRAKARARNINLVLPDAIVFMYALSESGMNLLDIIDIMADADDAYGDVAAEFDTIRRDIQLYGNDLYGALGHSRNLTPSENFEQFVDDLLSLLDSGGDTTTFLRDQSQRYLDRAKEEQEDLLAFLALLSEVFIVGFVAAPLFLIVILMIISLLGDPILLEMSAFIYLVLPLAFVGFAVLLSTLLDPYVEDSMRLRVDETNVLPSDDSAEDGLEDSEHRTFRLLYRLKAIRRRLNNPLEYFRAKPTRTLLVSAPVTALYLGALYARDAIPFAASGWATEPVAATNRVVVLPILVICVPVAVVHELNQRHKKEITERFPNTLNVLSSANSMGISLGDALGVIAQTSSGYYARELRILRNDIRWSNDPSAALLRFGNRLDVPALSRTIKLIAEGRRSTTDLSKVLRIAAEDTRNRFRLIRKRQQEMMSYVAVVIISYLVFLGVIVILEQSYLTPISELPEPPGEQAAIDGPTSLVDIPIDEYRVLFYHAVIVQALGTGLISGLLSDNSVQTGLKYSIVLILLAFVTFTVL